GHYLLSGGDDRRLVLWDIISGRFIRRTECPARPLALCFAEQDETALALLADHSVLQWDLITGQRETLLPSAEDSILLFHLSPDGQWALTFSAHNTLRVRHTKNSSLNWQFTSKEAAAGLQLLPENQSVALYRSDGSVLGHWLLANGTALENPPALDWQADSLLLESGNGQSILQQKNKSLVYLSLNQGEALAPRALPPDAFSGADVFARIAPGAFAYAPDGRHLLTTVYKTPPLFSVGGPVQSIEQATTTFLYIIDTKRDSLLATHTFSGQMSGFSISPDGRYIAGTVLEKIITFPIFGEKSQKVLQSQYNEVETVVHFSPQGDKAAFTEYNNDARTWAFQSRLPLQTLGRREFISGRGEAFSPTDGSIFFDGILSGVNSRMPDTLLNNHPILGWPGSAAFSADGKFLAAAMEDINFGYGVSATIFTVEAKDVLRKLYTRNGEYIGLETKQGKVLGYEWKDESLGRGEHGLILSTGHAWVWPADGSSPPLPLYTKEQARLVELQFTPDNKQLIGRFKNLSWLNGRWGYDTPPSQYFHIWNIREGLSVVNQSGQDTILAYWVNGPEVLAISPGQKEQYVLWSLSDGKNRQAFTLPAPVMAAGFSPDGTQVHCLLKGASYGILDVATGAFHSIAQLPPNCRRLQLSPDGRFIVFWEESRFHLWNIEQGAIVLSQGGEASIRTKIMREDPGTNGAGLNDVSTFYFLPDGEHAFSATYEGIIRLWALGPVREVATMIPMGHDWAVTTPSGLFDASSGAMEQIYYVVGREIVGLEQLKERYFEPGLLQKLLGYSDEPIRSVEGFESVPLYPEITAQIDTFNQQLLIRLKAREGGIGPVSVFLNGKEVAADANPKRDTALSFSLLPFGRYFLADSINRVSIRAYNREGWLKSPACTLPYRPPKMQRKGQGDLPATGFGFTALTDPSLYAIIIGTADYAGEKLDLKFAGRDAIALAQAIQQAGSQLFGPEQVHIQLFTTDTTDARLFPTKANIQGAFEAIRQQARAEDVLMVYCSGHGITYGNADQAQFYYLTQEIATENLSDDGIRATRAISTEELSSWINKVPALKQVMILDACNSGKVVESISSGQKNLNSSQIRALDRMKDRT
ncbi:MAG: caspase family protein, partial [Phaeodactylibacter sp.]|nr:caspase family protein [Phaeodactylibacter sp.]